MVQRRTVLGAATAATAATFFGNASADATDRTKGETAVFRMRSRILGADVPYSLYTPPGYRRGGVRTYPILYLLHGLTGDHAEWVRLGRVREIVDAAIAARRLPPTLVVMPDARRDTTRSSTDQFVTYYMDDADGTFRYAAMFLDEFIPYVENAHGAGGAAARRGICGQSMGGFGALSFALRRPGLFAAAFGFSVGHRTAEEMMALPVDEYNWRFARAWGADLRGRARLANPLYRQWNLLDTITRSSTADMSRTAWFLDCGSYDQFFLGNVELHTALTRKSVPHHFIAREGAHEWSYWTSGLPAALDFMATSWNGRAQ